MTKTSPKSDHGRVAHRSQAPRPPTLIKQSTRHGRRLGTWGWLALLLGSAIIGNTLDFTTRSGSIIMTVGVALTVLGTVAVRRSRGHLTRVLPSLSGIPDDQRIVLFLRAFADDKGFGRMAGFGFRRMWEWLTNPNHDEFYTEEEQVARAVDRFGQLVALGRPGDTIPPPGAQRSYPGDGSWQGEVLAALARARLVLLTAGPGGNLAWEVEQVIRRDEPTRLVILISHNKLAYADFAAKLGPRFPRGLPEPPRSKIGQWILRGRFVHAAIWFDSDWTPHLEMLDGRFPLIGILRRTQRAIPRALRQLYLREGLTVRRKRPIPPPRPNSVQNSIALFTVLWCYPFAFVISTGQESPYITILGLTHLLLPLAFWTYRIWRGGPYAIMTMQMFGLGLSFALITSLLTISDSISGSILSTILAGIFLFPLCLPGLLLVRHDARMWIQACA